MSLINSAPPPNWEEWYQQAMGKPQKGFGPGLGSGYPQHNAPSASQMVNWNFPPQYQATPETVIVSCLGCATNLRVRIGVKSHCPNCKTIVQQGSGNAGPQRYQPIVCEHCWKTDGRHTKACPMHPLNRPEDPRQKEMRLEREELAQDEEFGAAYIDTDENTFTDYIPARLKDVKSLKEHPDPVTETSTLASIIPPELNYKLKIPGKTITEGLLTSLQIESVMYACIQHEKFLPQQGVKAGFFMGDGPGVGKGRQIAGIVLENHVRGRKKAVWISVSADLVDDAKRDLRDIGAGAIPVHDLGDYKIHTKLSGIKKLQQGVLFSTYALLVREQKEKGSGKVSTRLQQILEWCGEGYEGVIAFDEAHKAKNMKPKRRKKQAPANQAPANPTADDAENADDENEMEGTKSAQAVINLQKRLPLARVVYVSATGASEPEHLLYASRLGLWGKGTSFANPQQFAKDIKNGGTGAMELLAMQMKQNGQYLARSLSFQGANFEVVEESLDPDFAATYNEAVALWADLRTPVQTALQSMAKGREKSKILSLYWGASQSFWAQMCMAAKVKGAVRIALEALENGKCVVIGLQSTGEAAAEEKDTGCSTANNILENFIAKWAPIAMDLKESLMLRCRKLQLPINPLDQLIDALGGPKRVAEMTGRQVRQVCKRGEWKYVARAKANGSSDAINIQERKRFMSGRKLVAIISEAASTGISLQADRRVKNSRRRVHITLQLPWSADKAVQQMGRSHRSNQSSAPEFVLLMTPIGGEWRFASAVAERLQQLGAITQGDRRATGRSGIQRFTIEQKYAITSLETLFNAIRRDKPTAEIPEFIQESYGGDFGKFAERALAGMKAAGMFDNSNGEVTPNTFMNRLLAIPIELQGQIFTFWQNLMDGLIRDDKLNGKYQEGIVDIASEKNNLEEQSVLHTNPDNGAETRYVKISGDRGISWERARELLQGQTEELAGFYKKNNARSDNQKHNMLLCLQKREQIQTRRTRWFNVVEPFAGFRPEEISRRKLLEDYEKVEEKDMEPKWKELFEYSEHNCGHKHKRNSQVCKGAECSFKKRLTYHHILTGNVLPVWEIIKQNLNVKDISKDKDQPSVKVVRVSTDCGRRFVGANIPVDIIEKVKTEILGRKTLSVEPTGKELIVISEDVKEEEEVLLEGGGKKDEMVDSTSDVDEKVKEEKGEGDENEGDDEQEGHSKKQKPGRGRGGGEGGGGGGSREKVKVKGDKEEKSRGSRKKKKILVVKKKPADKDGEEEQEVLEEEEVDCDGETEDDEEEELDTSTSSDKTEEDKKAAEAQDISDDDMGVNEEVASEDEDDDVPILQRPLPAIRDDEKVKDLASCGLWEEDEAANALFADGLKACGRGGTAAEEGDDDTEAEGTETEGEEEEEEEAAETPRSGGRGAKAGRGRGRPRGSAKAGEGSSSVRKQRKHKQRQDAASLLLDKAIKLDEETKKVRIDGEARQELKSRCCTFLGGLLGRQEVALTLSEAAVKNAIRSWIPAEDGYSGVGDTLRASMTQRPEMMAPKETLKRQIKSLHPSCVSRSLTSLSNKGINRVHAALAFFAQALVRQMYSRAVVRGIKTMTPRYLRSEDGFKGIRDPTLRHLLGLPALPKQDAPPPAESPASAPVVVRSVFKAPADDKEDSADQKDADTDDEDAVEGASAEVSVEVSEGPIAAERPQGAEAQAGEVSDAGTESETDLDDEDVEEEEEDEDEDQEMGTEEDSEEEMEASSEESSPRAADAPASAKRCCKDECKHSGAWSLDYFYIQCAGCDVWFHGDCVGVKEGDVPEEANWACCDDCADDIPIKDRVEQLIVGKPKKSAKAGSKGKDAKEPKVKTPRAKAAAGERKMQAKPAAAKAAKEATKAKAGAPAGKKASSWWAILVEEDWRDQRGFRLYEMCSDARPDGDCKGREWFSTAGMGDCAPGNQKFVPKTKVGSKKIQLKNETWLPVSVSDGKHRTASYKQIVNETDMVTDAYKVLDGKIPRPEYPVFENEASGAAAAGRTGSAVKLSKLSEEDGKAQLERNKKKPEASATSYCKKACQHGRTWDGEADMILCEACSIWYHADCLKVDIENIPEDAPWVCCHSCKYELPLGLRRKAVVGSAVPKRNQAAAESRVIDWKTNKVGVAKGGSVQAAAVVAEENAADDDDDSDDDVPILAMKPAGSSAAAKTSAGGAASSSAAGAGTSTDMPLSRLDTPMVKFTGQERMTKRDAMAHVLNHVKTNNLFDRSDWDYIIPDEKLQLIVGKKSRIKLRKLAKKVAQFLLEDEPDSGAEGGEPSKDQADRSEKGKSTDDTSGSSEQGKTTESAGGSSEKTKTRTPLQAVTEEESEEAAAQRSQAVKRLGFCGDQQDSDDDEDDEPLLAAGSDASSSAGVVAAVAEVAEVAETAKEMGVSVVDLEASAVEATRVSAPPSSTASVSSAVAIASALGSESKSKTHRRDSDGDAEERPRSKRSRLVLDSDTDNEDSSEATTGSTEVNTALPVEAAVAAPSDAPSVEIEQVQVAEAIAVTAAPGTAVKRAREDGPGGNAEDTSSVAKKAKTACEDDATDDEDEAEEEHKPAVGAVEQPTPEAPQAYPAVAVKPEQASVVVAEAAPVPSKQVPEPAQPTTSSEATAPSQFSTSVECIPDSDDEFNDLDPDELDAVEAASLGRLGLGSVTGSSAPKPVQQDERKEAAAPQAAVKPEEIPESDDEFMDITEEELLQAEQRALGIAPRS